jgi:hypothetical protein
MTESKKKKQHYVPRFYLKYFSNDPKKKTISLWNIQRQLYAANASIREQAYANNFYGKDGIIEDALALLESNASKVIHEILTRRAIPRRHSPDCIWLYAFIMFQAERTKASADDLEKMFDQLLKTAFKDHPKVKDYLPYVELKIKEPASEKLGISSRFVPLILDLRAKLILNTSEHEFVTSDNPVIRYNQFFELRRWPGSGAGWANPGLQVLFPLSPRLLLMLYDGSLYKVGKWNLPIANADTTSDVNRINGLQFIRADENIYLSNQVTQFHIQRMHNRWSKYRRPRVSVNEFFESNPDPSSSTQSSLLVSTMNELRTGLELSFVSFRRYAHKRKLGPTMWNPRNKHVERALLPLYPEKPKSIEKLRDHST